MDGCIVAYSINTYRRCCPGSLKYHNAMLSRERCHRCRDAQAAAISSNGINDSRVLSFISSTALVLAVIAVRSLLRLFINPLLGFLIYHVVAYGSINGVDSEGIPEGVRSDDVDNRGIASVHAIAVALFFMLVVSFFMALSSSQSTSMNE